jgi:hypothetical protein
MRANPRDVGGRTPRHTAGQRLINHVDTAGRMLATANGIYNAGKAILPYVRPVLTALAAAV